MQSAYCAFVARLRLVILNEFVGNAGAGEIKTLIRFGKTAPQIGDDLHVDQFNAGNRYGTDTEFHFFCRNVRSMGNLLSPPLRCHWCNRSLYSRWGGLIPSLTIAQGNTT